MLPDRVAQIDGHSGGFTVRETQTTYAQPAELIAYFHTLPAATQDKGLWVGHDTSECLFGRRARNSER